MTQQELERFVEIFLNNNPEYEEVIFITSKVSQTNQEKLETSAIYQRNKDVPRATLHMHMILHAIHKINNTLP